MYDHRVFFILIFPGESLPASLTEIIIFPGVILHVTSEGRLLSKSLLAKCAQESPIICDLKKYK